MNNIKLSVVIPSYKDKYLKNTINDLLEKSELGDQLEIIPVLDGYWVNPEDIVDDKRVKYLHLGGNRGMRGAINAGVLVSIGEYLMRVDEHQMFDKGYDRKILENIEDNWIVTPRRYCLDVEKWEVMNEIPPVDYAILKIGKVGKNKDFEDHPEENPYIEKFSGVGWDRPSRKDIMIDETFAMQGSCWFMKRSWWDKVIGELQTEGYGPLYQDSHEMVFKTWKAGGKLMVNKTTWHAHKHRKFPRTHSNGTKENPSNNEQCFKYSLNLWRDYFEKEIAPRQEKLINDK